MNITQFIKLGLSMTDYKRLAKSNLKRHNESTFLPNNEKVKFHSIVLIELFTFEEFPDLINGLDNLYNDLSKSENILDEKDYSIIEEIKNELKGSRKGFGGWYRLPPIYNSKFDTFNPFGVRHDLGSNFRYFEIQFYNLSNSLVALEINANLEPDISDKLNKIIYKEYSEDEITEKYPDGSKKRKTNPAIFKEKNVTKLRLELKKDIIEFLSKYFRGYFFKLDYNHIIIPSIDLYSLNYPEKNEDILKWGQESNGFLNCFGTNINYFFKSERCILCLDSESNYSSHIVFANRIQSIADDIENEIEGTISDIDFVMLSVYKWVDIQKNILNELNTVISNEIQNIEKNDLNEVLKNRKDISKKIYFFKRFKIEFEQIISKELFIFNFNFKEVNNREEKYCDLLKNISNEIFEMTKDIDQSINTLNEHSNLILNLKNVEYNKNMQEKVKLLTYLIIALTIMTIVVGVIQTLITWYKQ